MSKQPGDFFLDLLQCFIVLNSVSFTPEWLFAKDYSIKDSFCYWRLKFHVVKLDVKLINVVQFCLMVMFSNYSIMLLPDRTKQCRKKVMKFFADDENFVRRKFWPTKNVRRIILSKTKFSNIVRIHKCLSIARILG